MEKQNEVERYKEQIIQLLKEIEDLTTLVKIYTVVNTHWKMLKGEV